MEKSLAPQRKEWLDALRGLAIFLVVLLHRLPGDTWEKYIYVVITGPIKLPLFFAISGYVFNGRGGKQGKFFLNLLRKILIPSFVIFLGLRAVFIPTRGFSYVTTGILSFFSGELCWYITACLVAEILFFYNLKFCKKDWQICTVAIACCAAGFVMHFFGFGEFAMINRGFIAQFFLLIGYMFRKREDFFRKLHWSILLGGFLLSAAMITATFFLWPLKGIDVHQNEYYNIPYCFVLITVFVLSLMTLGTKLGKLSRLFGFIGKHTLVIYILHGFFLSIGERFLPLGSYTGYSTGIVYFLKCVALTVFSVAVCSGISALIQLVFPELMGRSRKKKEKAKE